MGKSPTVQQIEQTGKGHKGWMALGVMLVIIGIIVLFVGVGNESQPTTYTGILMTGGGAILFVVAKFAAWWGHG